MRKSRQRILARVAIVAAMVSVGQMAKADEVPMTKEIKAMVDFQCHGAKSLQQAEANLARAERDYTDQHPVVACLKKKVVELKSSAAKPAAQVAQQRQ
jgi:hypothetical protein